MIFKSGLPILLLVPTSILWAASDKDNFIRRRMTEDDESSKELVKVDLESAEKSDGNYTIGIGDENQTSVDGCEAPPFMRGVGEDEVGPLGRHIGWHLPCFYHGCWYYCYYCDDFSEEYISHRKCDFAQFKYSSFWCG